MIVTLKGLVLMESSNNKERKGGKEEMEDSFAGKFFDNGDGEGDGDGDGGQGLHRYIASGMAHACSLPRHNMPHKCHLRSYLADRFDADSFDSYRRGPACHTATSHRRHTWTKEKPAYCHRVT